MIDWKKSIRGQQIAQALTAIALVLWRIWAIPLVGLWRDWITLLAAFSLFIVFAENPRLRTRATLVGAAALMLIYAWGQFPHLLALFGRAA